jgi:hypothetical protein
MPSSSSCDFDVDTSAFQLLLLRPKSSFRPRPKLSLLLQIFYSPLETLQQIVREAWPVCKVMVLRVITLIGLTQTGL